MKNRFQFAFVLMAVLAIASCKPNPYKGFSGIEKKGMKRNKTPSQELREDYDKLNKRAARALKKKAKKDKKRLGTDEGKTPY